MHRPALHDPRWYKQAIIYELHVRSFYDSDADGIGDFQGLTQKLDYLQDLGVTALWLLPFYPSPLKDDGYDIADFFGINPHYGTMSDFKRFLREAHHRGLRVITELVLNHTSSQHAWFQRSRTAPPGSRWRDYYVWSDTPEKYKEVRIIFKDFESSNWTWDPVARAYYWHRFYSHQPDLNYDNPQVHREIFRVLDFWLDLGVDGFRLDAVPYLYEREGTSGESLPETHAFLRKLRKHMDDKYGDRILLAEANQWPEEAVTYFGAGRGDECHMAFHFPLMPRLFMAVRMEDHVPILDIIEQTPALPETSQWALFLRNHDELTLEMVTDEERDYMYRVFANDVRARINLGIRRRLAPLLGNDRRKIELLNMLLLSLSGTPVLYYGDEIGMGDNVFLGDRNGVRTPMHWSSDKNAGFSRAGPHGLVMPIILDPEYHYEAINVETQERNPNSLLWWTRRALALRKRWRVFGDGTIEFLKPENRKVLAFIRRLGDECILVVANLSRFPQAAQLDLARFRQRLPIELFGRTEFPVIGDQPYLLTLSPHAAFWFSLETPAVRDVRPRPAEPETVPVQNGWEELLAPNATPKFQSLLGAYLARQPWFPERARDIRGIEILDSIRLGPGRDSFRLLLLQVETGLDDQQCFLLPVGFAAGDEARALRRDQPGFVLMQIEARASGQTGLLFEPVQHPVFCQALVDVLSRRRRWKGSNSELLAADVSSNHLLRSLSKLTPSVEPAGHELHDGTRLKLFRELEFVAQPEFELLQFLTGQQYPNIPKLIGAIECRVHGKSATAALFTNSQGVSKTGWEQALDTLVRFFERTRTLPKELVEQRPASWPVPEHPIEVPLAVSTALGTFLELALILGRRTGEFHRALGSDLRSGEFAPEPFTPYYQRSLFESIRKQIREAIDLLRRQGSALPSELAEVAKQFIELESKILGRLRTMLPLRLEGARIRSHGDLHLAQVLYTGKDFLIANPGGSLQRPATERRIKKSPLADAAALLRSFDYVVQHALFQQVELGMIPPERVEEFQPWARFWSQWMSQAFVQTYLEAMADTALIPKAHAGLNALMTAFLLERAMNEIRHEFTRRSNLLKVPLQAVIELVEREPRTALT
jgi:maltose alpha-D-glucosyltransferase / alpha-amylase